MSWYWYYLIVGVYVSICTYGMSVYYKLNHKNYRRRNGIISWKLLYGIPIIIVIWPIVILGACYDTMRSSHLRQQLKNQKERSEVNERN